VAEDAGDHLELVPYILYLVQTIDFLADFQTFIKRTFLGLCVVLAERPFLEFLDPVFELIEVIRLVITL
jgi:hypothetical protein